MADETDPNPPSATWERIAARKREALLHSIPSEWIIPDALKPPESQHDVTHFPRSSGWFTERELDITARGAVDLLAKLRAGEWTSEEVTRAFCKRAAAAHQLARLFFSIQGWLRDETI
jgi:amidase